MLAHDDDGDFIEPADFFSDCGHGANRLSASCPGAVDWLHE
jgi:hypothetical protein